MKKNIHPKMFNVTATCTCGSTIEVRSTKQELHSTLCSSCHPFYTGTQKYVDTAGRIEKFNKRFAAKPVVKSAAPKVEQAPEKATTKASSAPKTAKK
jgi:large subunit ribosomal protein L31